MIPLTLIALITYFSIYLELTFSCFYILTIPIFSYFLLCFILMHFFNIEVATVNDIIQILCESKKSPSRIVVGVIYEDKLDEKDFVAKLKISAFAHPYYEKLKKKLCVFKYILLFGYWKKYDHFDINQHIEIIENNLNSMEELYSSIADKLSCQFPEDRPPWKMDIYPNFLGKKSACIFQIHHAYIDGISAFTYFLNLTECKNYSFINLPKISKWQWIFVLIVGIVKIFKTYFHFITWKRDKKPFHNGRISGIKSLFANEVCTLESIKKFSKQHEVTINDTLMTVLCYTLKQYCKRIYNEEIEDVLVMIPTSIRPMPKPEEHYPLTNYTVAIHAKFPMNFGKNIINTIKVYNKILSEAKKSYDIYYLKMALEFMPFFLSPSIIRKILLYICNKVSLVFTNVPGPCAPLISFGKYKVENIISSLNLFSDNALAFSLVSYNGKMTLTCIADREIKFDAKEFVELYEKMLERTIKGEQDLLIF